MNIDDALEEFIHARIEQFEGEDPIIAQFIKASEDNLIKLFDKVLETVPVEYHPVLQEYEEAAAWAEAQTGQLYYKRGICDGLILKRKIETISSEELIV